VPHVEVPPDLASEDADLVNPSCWKH
jgi:hypothetical protein